MKMSFVLLMLSAIATANPNEPKHDSGKILGKGTSLPKIQLKKPDGGWTVDQMIRVDGTVDDVTIDPITVSINGERYYLRTQAGHFARVFPASQGKNNIIVQGTNQAGVGSAERTVFSKAPPTPIKLVLTSDSDGIYTDLHVFEPKETAKDPYANLGEDQIYHVFWARTSSPTGGTFYLNQQAGDYDRPGYGPYLYTHSSPQAGIYQVATNYWPSGDRGHTVAYLNVTLFGGTQKEVQRRIKIPLAKQGETKILAYIRIDKGGRGYIFAPGTDQAKKNDPLWPEWVRLGQGAYAKLSKDDSGEGSGE